MSHAMPLRRPFHGLRPVAASASTPADDRGPDSAAKSGALAPGWLGMMALACVLIASGCQTPQQTAAMPMAYPSHPSAYPAPMTVAPPATGMIGQPAPYGNFAAAPMAPQPTTALAPPSLPAAPAAAAPTNNSWTWAPSSQPAAPPNIQQYGNQLQNQTNQYAQGLNNQAQQYTNQLQQQPQQMANQMQQYANQQGQQINNQLQAAGNQYSQQFNNQLQQFNNQTQAALQSQQQALSGQIQQAMPQVPQQQTANGNWWPFTSPAGMPPSRSTPAQPVKY